VAIIVRLDVMLATRKMKSKDLAASPVICWNTNQTLEDQRLKGYCPHMTRLIDMDDKTRLPWRFHGEFLSVMGDL